MLFGKMSDTSDYKVQGEGNMAISIKAGQGSADVYPAAQESSQPRKTIDARNLKGLDPKHSAIDKKRENARKQAMKLVQNAWNRDTKSAAEQKDLEAQKADKLTEVQKLTEQMKNIEETKKIFRKNTE